MSARMYAYVCVCPYAYVAGVFTYLCPGESQPLQTHDTWEELKKVANFFQVTIRFHPGHPQTTSFD